MEVIKAKKKPSQNYLRNLKLKREEEEEISIDDGDCEVIEESRKSQLSKLMILPNFTKKSPIRIEFTFENPYVFGIDGRKHSLLDTSQEKNGYTFEFMNGIDRIQLINCIYSITGIQPTHFSEETHNPILEKNIKSMLLDLHFDTGGSEPVISVSSAVKMFAYDFEGRNPNNNPNEKLNKKEEEEEEGEGEIQNSFNVDGPVSMRNNPQQWIEEYRNFLILIYYVNKFWKVREYRDGTKDILEEIKKYYHSTNQDLILECWRSWMSRTKTESSKSIFEIISHFAGDVFSKNLFYINLKKLQRDDVQNGFTKILSKHIGKKKKKKVKKYDFNHNFLLLNKNMKCRRLGGDIKDEEILELVLEDPFIQEEINKFESVFLEEKNRERLLKKRNLVTLRCFNSTSKKMKRQRKERYHFPLSPFEKFVFPPKYNKINQTCRKCKVRLKTRKGDPNDFNYCTKHKEELRFNMEQLGKVYLGFSIEYFESSFETTRERDEFYDRLLNCLYTVVFAKANMLQCIAEETLLLFDEKIKNKEGEVSVKSVGELYLEEFRLKAFELRMNIIIWKRMLICFRLYCNFDPIFGVLLLILTGVGATTVIGVAVGVGVAISVFAGCLGSCARVFGMSYVACAILNSTISDYFGFNGEKHGIKIADFMKTLGVILGLSTATLTVGIASGLTVGTFAGLLVGVPTAITLGVVGFFVGTVVPVAGNVFGAEVGIGTGVCIGTVVAVVVGLVTGAFTGGSTLLAGGLVGLATGVTGGLIVGGFGLVKLINCCKMLGFYPSDGEHFVDIEGVYMDLYGGALEDEHGIIQEEE